MNFLYYALITVVCWGTYGVCMHIGSTNMGDKENGRIMAFLWVGLAYFLTAVVAPLIILKLKGGILLLGLPDQGLAVVPNCGYTGCNWCTWSPTRIRQDAFTGLCASDYVDYFCGCTDGQCSGKHNQRRKLVLCEMALCAGNCNGCLRRIFDH